MTASDKINILIIEDNEDHLFFIKKTLSDKKYVLQHLVSGTEAYNYLLNPTIKPDVVLLDNHLPGMSGLEILKKLGTKTEDYGFIVTTVDKDPDIIVNSMRAGALDFSPKTPEYFYILPQKIDKVYEILKDKLEKKQLKKVLKTQEKALEAAEEIAKLGSFTLDLKTYKGHISKAFRTITGFKEKRLIYFYKDWRKIVHPDDVSGNQKALEKALKTSFFNHTYRIITLDTQQIKWIHGLGKIEYKNKKPVTFIGTIQDITESKKQELTKEVLLNIAKRANESLKLEKLFSFIHSELGKLLNVENFYIGLSKENSPMISVPYMIDEKDSDYDFPKKNSLTGNVIDKGKSLLVSNSEMKAQNLIQQGPPSLCWLGVPLIVGKKAIGAIVVQSYKDQKAYTQEDQSLLEIIASNISQVIKNAQDVEQVKSLNSQLQHAEKITQLGSYNLDFISKTYSCSPILKDIIGIKPNDPRTIKAWESIVHPDDVAENKKRLRQSIKTGRKFDIEYAILTYNKKELKYIHALGEIIYKNGKATNMVGTVQDITQRKKAEQELIQSKERFEKSILLAPNPIMIHDEDNKILQLSKGWTHYSGYTLKDIPTISDWTKKAYGIRQDFANDYIKKLFKINKTENNGEWLVKTKKGATRIWEFYTTPLGVFHNKKVLLSIAFDITDRKALRNNLKEERDKYNFILESLPIGVTVVDKNDKFIYFNKKSKDLDSYPNQKQHIIGENILSVHPKNKKREVEKLIAEFKTGQKSLFTREAKRGKKDVEITYRVIKVQNKYNGILRTVRDISNIKEYLKSIQLSKERYKQVFDNTPIPHQSLNDKIQLIDVNKAWLKALGYKREEVINKPFTDFMLPESAALVKDRFSKFKACGYIHDAVFKMAKKDGSVIMVNYNGNVALDSKGNFKQTYCSFADITKQKRLELTKEVIYNIIQKAQDGIIIKDYIDYIRTQLNKIINTDNFFIAIYNDATGMISTPYMVDEQDEDSDFPKGKTLTGYLIDAKKSFLLTKKEIIKLQKVKKVNILGPMCECWLGVPFIRNDKVLGAIVVQSYKDEKAYNNEDLDTLELIASNISQALKQSQDLEQIHLLSHALKQSAESVIITDVNGTIEYVNLAFTKLSAYIENEVIGQNPRFLKSGKQSLEYYENLWNTILNGNIWTGEFVNKRKDSTEYLVHANISPIKNEKGVITHFVAIEEDITEKRKLERDLIHAFIDAQEEEKISFGEDLHDGISQILSAEAMFIQVLIQQNKNKDVLDAQSLKYLESVKNLNLKAINEARSIAHGLMSKQLKEDGLIKAIAHVCKDYNGSKNIIFKYVHKGLKETDINKAIKINIFRIIQEISTNTIRHSGAKKAEISLLKTPNNMLQLIYSDNGVGIDFEKMKREKKGAGLKNIERRVALLKGTYTLDSVLNKGVKYTIEVPLFNI
jgi:PAS domain S-box-containing protein